jgi:FkbM family methyltransferase
MGISVAGFLPEKFKAAVRPFYRKVFQRIATDKDSNLTIGSFCGLEIAFRENTTDHIIVGNGAGYRLEALVPEYKPERDHVIVNIGAHIGVSSLMASVAVPLGKVFAVEASKETFNFLRINVALNKAENISSHHLAISDKPGICTLYHDTGHWGHSITKKLSTHSETVESITLGQFLEQNKINRCNFLYLNCEGAEFPILLGAPAETLQKIDLILADVHSHLWDKNTIGDLLDHLEKSGFHARAIESDGGYDRVLAVRSLPR